MSKALLDKHGLLRRPSKAGLESLDAALLISTRTLHGCSLLENADGTGSTLLDNAGVIILSIFS